MSQTLPFVGPTQQSQKQADPVYLVNPAGEYAGGTAGLASTSANVTTVAANTASVQLLAANPARRGLIITNATDMQLRIKYGPNASATSYTVLLGVNGVFEAGALYLGAVTAISPAAAIGNYHVTELI